MLARVVRREDSAALSAEAIHYRVDAATSLLATVGLAVGAVVPSAGPTVDHLTATVLAAIMVALGIAAVRKNLDELLDRVPDTEQIDRVRKAAGRVRGVLGVEKVRIQSPGPDAHVDIDVEVDPHLTVHEAHHISQHVRAEIQRDWPAVREVVVHVEPFYDGDH
jgi:cation diffusion facilitator family transporter